MVMKFSGKPITFNKGHTVADHSAVVEALLGNPGGDGEHGQGDERDPHRGSDRGRRHGHCHG